MTENRRTRLDPDLRRGQILAAATSLFRSDPYDAVSLEAVAERAGVTRGLLHHYFGSKRALYLAVVEDAVSVPDDVALIPPGVDGDFAEVVAASVDSWMRMVKAAGGLFSGGGGASGFSDDDLDAVMTRARDDLVERMAVEVPFPDGLDRDLLRSALRAYAAMARVATQEWSTGRVTEAQAAALLRTALVAVAEQVVPAMTEEAAR